MDQELKQKIFTQIKYLMQPYASKLEVRGQKENQYHLYGTKEVQLAHKLEKGMYFTSVMINKGFVGFYFFPIYTHPQEFQGLNEDLLKCLKGKSCFHIKKDDAALYESINEALERGFTFYEGIAYL